MEMERTMAQIRLVDVNVLYEDNEVGLENISLRIEKGEFVFFTGRSGAGKSTLLKVINGRVLPSSGEVWVEDSQVNRLEGRKLQLFRRHFGLMEREFELISHKTVYENLAFVMRAVGNSPQQIKREIPKILTAVGIGACAGRYAEELSGGQAARALLARAICLQPDILIVDEPTANLDWDSSWDIMCLLEEINQKLGTTVLVASHQREIVSIMKKRVITMAAGNIVADEKNAIYNNRAADIFEERRILHERSKRNLS